VNPAARRGLGRTRQRGRLAVGLGATGLAFGAVLVFALRPRPEPYSPGSERESGEEITRVRARPGAAAGPPIAFVDAAAEAGLVFRHFDGRRSTQLPEDMGSGAAWGDFDGDGDADLFLVNESGPLTLSPAAIAASATRGRLFRNDGGVFVDVTGAAGIAATGCGMGAAWGDFDGDRDLDLVVTRFGTSLLYRNDGEGRFTDVSATSGVGGPRGFWTGAAWADYDRDGDLDLYVCGYVQYRSDGVAAGSRTPQYKTLVPSTLNPSSYPPERNLLFRNERGRFDEVARAAGVDNPTGRSLSATWADFDGDLLPDLYVANDVSDNALFHNRGDGTFADISHPAWVADPRGAMGLAVGDWNNDGDADIFITHWLAQENALYDNQRGTMAATPEAPLHFVDRADDLGLGQIALDFVGWGTEFFDYDNDGRLDLLAVNGSTFPLEGEPTLLTPMRNQLFWNAGPDEGFLEVGAGSGPAFAIENVARGAATADYDDDGDLDAVVVVNRGEVRLLRNDGGNKAHRLRVVLRGPAEKGPRPPRTTTNATGALVRAEAGGVVQVREVGGASSYLSQSPPGEVWFGLGEATQVDRLEVVWPDGRREEFHDLPVPATATITEGAGISIASRMTREMTVRFWDLFRRATRLRTSGDFTAAAGDYQAALGIDPNHEDALYYLGQCRFESGDAVAARRAFERLLSINRNSARGELALAGLLASPDLGPFDLASAEAHLRRAHAINAEETGALVRLGEIRIVRGDLAEAGALLEAACRTNPKSVEAAFLAGYLRWEAGRRDEAERFLQRARRGARPDAPAHGVLSEGDRKVAAPPLSSTEGRTLFGDLSAPLRGAGATAASKGDLDSVYAPVRDRAAHLVARAVTESRTQVAPAGR